MPANKRNGTFLLRDSVSSAGSKVRCILLQYFTEIYQSKQTNDKGEQSVEWRQLLCGSIFMLLLVVPLKQKAVHQLFFVCFLQVLTLYCWKPDSNKELYNFKVNKWQYIHLVGLVQFSFNSESNTNSRNILNILN